MKIYNPTGLLTFLVIFATTGVAYGQKQTPTGYYENTGQQVGLAVLAVSEGNQLTDLKGNPVFAKKDPFIPPEAIEAIYIEKIKTNFGIDIEFRDDWGDKVEQATSAELGHELGLFRDKKLIFRARLLDPLRQILHFQLTSAEPLALLVKGMKKNDAMTVSDYKKRKLDRAALAANNTKDDARKLAYAQSLLKAFKFQDVVDLTEPIVQKQDEHSLVAATIILGDAYQKLDRTPQAIALYQDTLSKKRRNWGIREYLARARAANKEYEKAYTELTQFLNDTNTAMAIADLERQQCKLEQSNNQTASKEDSIKKVRDRIEKLRKQLTE